MAEDGMLPNALAKRNRYNAPYVAAIVTAIASVLLAWSGSFTTLAAISAVSRFTQYLPTCLAVHHIPRKWADKERSTQSLVDIPFQSSPLLPPFGC